MRALQIHQHSAPLELEDISDPAPDEGEVLVRNLATSLNPIDQKRAAGAMRQVAPVPLPWVPNGDMLCHARTREMR